MPNTYEQPSQDLRDMVQAALERYHPILHQCGVTIAILFIDDIDEESGESHQALKCNGYPAAATIAINPLKLRALKLADALMVLDAKSWSELDVEEQIALVDHELHHLQVRGFDRGFVGLNGAGKIDRSAKVDDQRRPVLKLRKHDWQLGGFAVVAKRHRAAAIEVQQAKSHLDRTTGQYAWDFGASMRIAHDDDRPSPTLAERLLDGGATVSRIGNKTTIEIPVAP